jgi:hypothetical protein
MNKLIILIILASLYGCENETKSTPKFVRKTYPKSAFKEAKDWQSDSTVSMERRNVYKYWQSIEI